MSKASEPTALPIPTPRVARKAVAQPAAGLPLRQNPSQQYLGQSTGSVSVLQAGSVMDSSASTTKWNGLDHAPIPVSDSMPETDSVYATKVSRRSTIDLAQRPLANAFQTPGLSQRSTAGSVASIPSSRSSISGLTLVSSATDAIPSSISSSPANLTRGYSHCGNCKEAIPTSQATIQCLICSPAKKPNVIPGLCLQCYAAGASWAGHNHDVSFYACDSDTILPDTGLPQHTWIVRRNASKRLWYEHRQSRYKTYMRPMTAVCRLPSGWQQRKDPEGRIYYENTLTGQSSRSPGGLPSGWREAKDPDGKLFFVHDELQLASWYRPGEQPPVPRDDSGGQVIVSNSAGNTSNVMAKYSRPDIMTKPAPVVVKPNPIAVKPNGASPTATVQPPSSQQVTLQTATEATINLIDPSGGGIVRNTKIAAHIAGQSVMGTVKAVKYSKRLQNFARGTGIAAANHQVKKGWRKAAREVDSRNRQEVTVIQSGSQGQGIILEEVDDGYNGEYVVEYDDGMVEYYSADGQLRCTVERQNTSGVRPSQLVSSGQEVAGQQRDQNRPQQYQTRQKRYQNTQQQAYLLPSTDSSWDAGSEESTFVSHLESQGLYADQEQNIYIHQSQDPFTVQSQDTAVEGIPTIDQDVSFEQNITVVEDQSLISLGLGTQQEFGIKQELEVEYDQSYDPEIETEGEGFDVAGDFDAGGDMGACVDF